MISDVDRAAGITGSVVCDRCAVNNDSSIGIAVERAAVVAAGVAKRCVVLVADRARTRYRERIALRVGEAADVIRRVTCCSYADQGRIAAGRVETRAVIGFVIREGRIAEIYRAVTEVNAAAETAVLIFRRFVIRGNGGISVKCVAGTVYYTVRRGIDRAAVGCRIACKCVIGQDYVACDLHRFTVVIRNRRVGYVDRAAVAACRVAREGGSADQDFAAAQRDRSGVTAGTFVLGKFTIFDRDIRIDRAVNCAGLSTRGVGIEYAVAEFHFCALTVDRAAGRGCAVACKGHAVKSFMNEFRICRRKVDSAAGSRRVIAKHRIFTDRALCADVKCAAGAIGSVTVKCHAAMDQDRTQ